MTPRKTREAKIVATEDAVFGYRPPSSRKFMNSSDEAGDDLITDDDAVDEEPTYSEARTMKITIGELRKVIREEAGNAFSQGLKSTTLEVIQKKWPTFYQYLAAKFGDQLPQAKCGIKKTGMFGGEPWVLLPDRNRTVIFWNSKQNTFVYSSSETAAAALANL